MFPLAPCYECFIHWEVAVKKKNMIYSKTKDYGGLRDLQMDHVYLLDTLTFV